MSWTDENEFIINNESTNYEELELVFAKLRREYKENNEFLCLGNRKLGRLEETMNNTLNEEQTINKDYRSKTLKDIENKMGRQRAFLAPYTQGGIQTAMDSQVKELHQTLLGQRNQEQKKVLIQWSMNILTPLRCLVLALSAFWLVWGE